MAHAKVPAALEARVRDFIHIAQLNGDRIAISDLRLAREFRCQQLRSGKFEGHTVLAVAHDIDGIHAVAILPNGNIRELV